jgi:hypothetical protein
MTPRPPRRPRRPRGTPAAGQAGAAGPAIFDPDSVAASEQAADEVAPISAGPAHAALDGWEGAPPLTADVDHTCTGVPLPPAPPPEDSRTPPPPEDAGPPAATVDPITDR